MAEYMPALAKNTTDCQLEDELGTKRSQTEMTGSSEKKILVTKVLFFPVLSLLTLIYI